MSEPGSLDLRSWDRVRLKVGFVDGDLGCRRGDRFRGGFELNLVDHVDEVGDALKGIP